MWRWLLRVWCVPGAVLVRSAFLGVRFVEHACAGTKSPYRREQASGDSRPSLNYYAESTRERSWEHANNKQIYTSPQTREKKNKTASKQAIDYSKPEIELLPNFVLDLWEITYPPTYPIRKFNTPTKFRPSDRLLVSHSDIIFLWVGCRRWNDGRFKFIYGRTEISGDVVLSFWIWVWGRFEVWRFWKSSKMDV